MSTISESASFSNSTCDVTPTEIHTIPHTGYLYKRISSLLHHGTFHPRFCVLLESSFDYYPSQRQYCKLSQPDNEKHRKRISLAGASLISVSNDPKYSSKPFAFKILEGSNSSIGVANHDTGIKRREFVWSADTKESFDVWFNTIEMVIDKLNSSSNTISKTVTHSSARTVTFADQDSTIPDKKDEHTVFQGNHLETNESFEERQQFSSESQSSSAPCTANLSALPFPLPAKYLANDPYKQYITPQFPYSLDANNTKISVDFAAMDHEIDSIAENEAENYDSCEDDCSCENQYSKSGSTNRTSPESNSYDHAHTNLSPYVASNKDVTVESKYPTILPITNCTHGVSRPNTPRYSPKPTSSPGPRSGALGIPRSLTANDIFITPNGLPVDMISPKFIETPPNTPATPLTSPSLEHIRDPRGTSEPYLLPLERTVPPK